VPSCCVRSVRDSFDRRRRASMKQTNAEAGYFRSDHLALEYAPAFGQSLYFQSAVELLALFPPASYSPGGVGRQSREAMRHRGCIGAS